MKLTLVICVVALVASVTSYKLKYKAGNYERFETGFPGTAVQGLYRYRNNAGDKVTVKYVADDEGFRVTDTDVDHYDDDDDDDDDEDDTNVYHDSRFRSGYEVKADDNIRPYRSDFLRSAYKVKADDNTMLYHSDVLKSAYDIADNYDDDDVNVYYDEKRESAYVVKYDDDEDDYEKVYRISKPDNPTVQFKTRFSKPTITYNRQYVPYKVENNEVKFRAVQTPEGYYPHKVTEDDVEFKRLRKPGPFRLVPYKLDDDEAKLKPVSINKDTVVEDTSSNTPAAKSSLDTQKKTIGNSNNRGHSPIETTVLKDDTGTSLFHPYFPFSIPKDEEVDGNVEVVVVKRRDDEDDD